MISALWSNTEVIIPAPLPRSAIQANPRRGPGSFLPNEWQEMSNDVISHFLEGKDWVTWKMDSLNIE